MMDNFKLNRDDFPSLYLSASDISAKNQNLHTFLIRTNLIFLVFAATSTSFTMFPQYVDIQMKIGVFSAGIALLCTILVDMIGTDKLWYAGRAIAESVKTTTWKFITKSEPFDISKSDRESEKLFLEILKEIFNERKYLAAKFSSDLIKKPQITDNMRKVRKMKFSDRLKIYLEMRIKHQQSWYADKAGANNMKANKFTFSIYILEFLTIVFIIYTLNGSFDNNDFVGLLTTTTSCLIAWTQLKQFQTLSQSYAVASEELGMIIDESTKITNSKLLSEFVLNSENAISREHTLWIARRQK